MFDSKSPAVKIVGYIVIGFFLLIIIISFGMPSIMPQMGLDGTVAAIVNGKKLDRADFARYRDNLTRQYPYLKNKGMSNYILDDFIRKELLYQYTRELEFTVTDDRINNLIRSEFVDPNTGKYSPEMLKLYMKNSHLSFNKLSDMLRRQIALNDFNNSIRMGISISSRDIKEEHLCRNSQIQIRYAFLSKQDIKKRYTGRIAVSDEEVAEEMKKNTEELKDPKTDRKRIKDKLEKKKIQALENELVEKINTIASQQGSFAGAAALLKGTAGISEVFKIGETVKERGKKGKSLGLIGNSQIFRESALTLKPGASSKAIQTPTGIYIFTPVMQKIAKTEPDEKEKEAITRELEYQNFNMALMNVIQKLSEESKITKNLKTD